MYVKHELGDFATAERVRADLLRQIEAAGYVRGPDPERGWGYWRWVQARP